MARRYNDMTDEELRRLASDNSAAWFGAGNSERDRLHEENVAIKSVLDQRTGTSSSYDAPSGKWTTTGAASYAGAGTKGYDDNPSFDYSRYMGQLMSAGSRDADYLTKLLTERSTKAVNNGTPQYANDDFSRQAQSYINGLRRDQTVNAQAPVYSSPYAEQIRAKAAEVLSRDPFSYDYQSDPAWQSYRKQYVREGQRAAADTLGQYAAMTGGMPSTAAVTASQQAGDYYNAKMTDILPALYQAAYGRYQDEGNAARQDLNTLMQMDQNEYNRYLTELGQFNTDRAFQYGVQQDEQEARRAAELLADSRAQSGRSEARSEVDAILAALGTPSEELLRESGYSQGYADTLANYYANQAELANRARTGGGGSGGGGGGNTPAANDLDYEGLFQAARESGNPRSWLSQKSNYSRYGFTSSSGLWADYQNWAEGDGEDPAENQRNSAANPEALEYSPDEGVFTWNGKKYSSANAFRSAVQSKYLSGGISREQARKILDAANAYGFRF